MYRRAWVELFVGALLSAGCGTVAQRREAQRRLDQDSYLPLEVGTVWRYAITRDDGQRGSGTIRITGIDYDGSDADAIEYRVRKDLLDGTTWTWEDREPKRVRQEQKEHDDHADRILDEETFDPPITVLDERAAHLVAGAKWSEAFFDTVPNLKGHPKSKRVEVKWEVEALAVPVTVPAGTFSCLRVRRTRKHHAPLVSWYARGVGLVRQTGAGARGDQTLALAEVHRP